MATKKQDVHESVKEADAENKDVDAPKEAPGGFHPDDARAKDEEDVVVDENNPLAGLSRRELVRLRSAVDTALDGFGEEPEDPVAGKPTLTEVASTLPVNPAAAEELDRSKVASKLDGVKEEEVYSFSIRQAGASEDKEKDTGYGPSYLTAVLADGSKRTVEV